MSKKPKIYFLGSGNLAVPILKKLLSSSLLDIAGIGTQKDRISGRGKHLTPTPIGHFLETNGISSDKPDSVNSNDFLEKIMKINPDFIFTASYGQLLKDQILALPKVSCVNAHASILPAYRGASPIHSAILNGDTKTGISFMKMEKGLDTGPIYMIIETDIRPHIKMPELENEIGNLAANHVENVLLTIYNDNLIPYPQPEKGISHAKKIQKEQGRINWKEDAIRIGNKMRAFHPWPGVFFEIDTGIDILHLKITEMEIIDDLDLPPGTIITENGKFIVACGCGAILLVKVIPQGRREMRGDDFLRGFHGTIIKIANSPINSSN